MYLCDFQMKFSENNGSRQLPVRCFIKNNDAVSVLAAKSWNFTDLFTEYFLNLSLELISVTSAG